MNKLLKAILICINVLMLYLAYKWYTEEGKNEPLIAILGQITTLIVLLCEKQFSKIITKKIFNSNVDVDVNSGDEVETKEINNSTINIKTK